MPTNIHKENDILFILTDKCTSVAKAEHCAASVPVGAHYLCVHVREATSAEVDDNAEHCPGSAASPALGR
ncbi:hypothetical protein J6590_023582 [Homalodisca vitripennis]|nr:hypothetical protein J6590_023582 [Homalodisca vitripennis]